MVEYIGDTVNQTIYFSIYRKFSQRFPRIATNFERVAIFWNVRSDWRDDSVVLQKIVFTEEYSVRN